jgi:hypothetical protein
VIAPETEDRQLELWPAVGALLLAGLFAGIASTMFLRTLAVALAPGPYVLFQVLVTAALTAAAIPYAVRTIADFEITTGEAFAVSLGSSLVALAAAMLAVRGGGPAAATLSLVGSLAAGTYLLRRFARPKRATKPPLAVEAELAYATSVSSDLPADVEHASARVRLVLSSLAQAEPVDVPARVQEALEELEEEAAGLESERDLDAPRKLFVAGIRQLQGELVELAEAAWRGDHRSAINRLDGVRTIENALSQLRA